MDNKSNTITLYTAQTKIVTDVLTKDGICFSKEAYVRKKYQESAPIFVTTYSWFVEHAKQKVPRPEGAEYPYWAFLDLYNVDATGSEVQILEVPMEEAIFFDLMDWNKIMRLSYIGETEAEEKAFREELKARGLNNNTIMLTNFYPEYKKQIMDSWERLFRHHEAIKAGDLSGVHGVQAGLWRIKKEWWKEGCI